MRPPRHKPRLIHHLLLTIFLVAAQWGALGHAFEHDDGTPNRVCTTCVAASQLGFACVDTSVTMESAPAYFFHNTKFAKEIRSIHALVARQRGPPTLL